MRVLQINIVYNHGSTGVIAKLIANMLIENGDEAYFAFDGSSPERFDNGYPIGNRWIYRLHAHLFTKYLDREGFGSYWATKRFCHWIDKIKPDIIHIHNMHGSYINIRLLFDFINSRHLPVVMTLHDCWTMTGHCYHFDSVGCERWKTGCHDCPLHGTYPVSKGFDHSKSNYLKKKKLFTSVERMVVVSVSHFIDDIVNQSFLCNYQHLVMHNGIDLTVFKPTEAALREKLKITDGKIIILGVSSGWNNDKGLEEMIWLSRDEKFQVILIGVQDGLLNRLPSEIIAIKRTEDQRQLAEYYTMADVFVNPTYNDSFPTVNIESLACGTPVATYRTGGSPEAIDQYTGAVVERGNKEGLKESILLLAARGKKVNESLCCKRANDFFNQSICYNSYLDIYEQLLQ